MVEARHIATEADLRRMPDNEWKYKLVDGRIRAEPRGDPLHSLVCVALGARVASHVAQGHLGDVFASNTGVRLPNGNVRAPDVSFVSAGRLPRISDDFVAVEPDLAIEVLAPNDSSRSVLNRVGDYLEAGTRLVWVIDPAAVRAGVSRSLMDVRGIGRKDSLDGEDIVPGFRCTLAEVLT